jgi:hypothetical protein
LEVFLESISDKPAQLRIRAERLLVVAAIELFGPIDAVAHFPK